jgi:hypothetical protein
MTAKKSKDDIKLKADVRRLLELLTEIIMLLFKKFKWAIALSSLISYILLHYDILDQLIKLIKAVIMSQSSSLFLFFNYILI